MTQIIENTNFRTRMDNLVDGQLLVIPWPTGFIAGTVSVNAASSTVAGLVHARSGGSPLTVSLSSLANFVVTSTDLTASPPALGTGKITIGRSITGFQIHSGGVFGVTTTFLG